MNLRIANENFGKIKAHQFKADTVQILKYAIKGLKEVTKHSEEAPISIRPVIRESIQIIAKDKNIATELPNLIYTPGKEKELLQMFETCYTKYCDIIVDEPKEEARARKMRMDKALILGKRLLAANKTTEADQAFQEAVKCYKNEKTLFIIITELLCEAQEYVRAKTYLKKAMEVYPHSDKKIQELNKVIYGNLDE